MEEKFTEQESKTLSINKNIIKQAKENIKRVEGLRREREEKARAERVAARLRDALDTKKKARDNKIRGALLEMSETAKKYGMKFDAPPMSAGWRFKPERFASFKLHVTDVSGKTEVVQIYTRHDGFEWD